MSISAGQVRRHRSDHGFTLIELMIVVAIVAALAVVAIVAYTRHLKSGRLVGAREFVSSIQARQAAYFQQHGWYCDASGGTTFYPALAVKEPRAKTWTSVPSGWSQLGLRPEGGVVYGATMVRASNPNASPAHTLSGDAYGSALGIPAQPTTVTDAGVPATPHPWYYIVSHLDLDGSETSYPNGGCTAVLASTSGTCTILTSTSAQTEIKLFNEGK